MVNPTPNTVEKSADNLLGLLKDIHSAAPADWWPLAPGWWILTIAIVILLSWLGKRLYRAWKRYRFKVMVKTMLVDIFQTYSEQPRELLVELNQLFKRWLTNQGAHGLQQLSGAAWAAYLQGGTSVNEAEQKVIETLATAQYQTDIPVYDVELLKAWALRWLAARVVING
ncbi:MAG: DUF4381 domain-containing protein [Xanthomonadales bacterium]|nr:DUF4381 domain-containing protein [Xanthomonadales bacterium]